MGTDVDDFDITVSDLDGGAVVSVTGELDLATASRLRNTFASLMDRGMCTVCIDMGGLRFIDSTGLSVLVAGLKRFRERGGDLTLRSPRGNAAKVLEITGLMKIFVIT